MSIALVVPQEWDLRRSRWSFWGFARRWTGSALSNLCVSKRTGRAADEVSEVAGAKSIHSHTLGIFTAYTNWPSLVI